MKIDIITGCDSGIGYALVEEYIKMGKEVIYSFLDKDPFNNSQITTGFHLDLRTQESIENFADSVMQLLDSRNLDIGTLFNNSGIGIGGPIEETPLTIYREVMEVNFFGTIYLTQRLLPLIVKSKGKVMIHGSMAGKISLPFFSPYSSSKFALEGLTDSLRRELKRDGVEVSLIETGGIATPIWDKVEKQDISFISPRYRKSIDTFIKNFVIPAQSSMPVTDCAKRIYKIFRKKKFARRYKIAKSSFRNYLLLLIPEPLKDFIFRKMSNL